MSSNDINALPQLIQLDGRSYAPTKKLIIYSILGDMIKHNPINIGKITDDTRINLGIPMKSGHGKTIMKNFIKATYKAIDPQLKCSEPTSLHPEQLVGKCISEDAVVLLANGTLKSIHHIQDNDIILSIDNNYKLVENRVVKKIDSGKQSIYELVTEDGRKIKATREHPFLVKMRDILSNSDIKYKSSWYAKLLPAEIKWIPLSDLKVGDEIAVPKRLVFGNDSVSESEVKIIAYLVGEGSLSVSSLVQFSNADRRIVGDMRDSLNNYKCILRPFSNKDDNIDYRIVFEDNVKFGTRRPNPVLELLRKYNLEGKVSSEKEIPVQYLSLKKELVALFLNRLYACDGNTEVHKSIQNNRKFSCLAIAYSSTSKRLVEQVSHLLHRFGIRNTIITVQTTYKNNPYFHYKVIISERESVTRFLDEIGIFTKDELVDRCLLENKNMTKRRKFTDEQLVGLMKKYDGCIARVAKELDVNDTAVRLRYKILAEKLSEKSSDIMFVKIKEISAKGIEQTYDIQMGNSFHNFVANDMVAHNTIMIRDEEDEAKLASKINKGYLADDFLIYDEAIELLTDRDFQQARDYINIALDPIGQNEIMKRSVDASYEEAVRYMPECTMVFFFHPIQVPESLVTRGLLRRLFVTYPQISRAERAKALANSFVSSNSPTKFSDWISLCKELRGKHFSWSFPAKEKIIDLTNRLVAEGERYSEKVASYTEVMFFTLRNRLMKLACVLGALNGTSVIKEEYVKQAYIDLKDIWYNQMTFVEERVLGDLTYGMKMSQGRDFCIEILKEKKAFSEASTTLSIDNLVTELAKRLNRSVGCARYYYLQLVREGIVETRKYQHDSKVWLNLVLLSGTKRPEVKEEED